MGMRIQSLDDVKQLIRQRMTELKIKPYRVEQLAGIPERIVARFMEGSQPSFSLENLFRIMTAIGMNLEATRQVGFKTEPSKPVGRPKGSKKTPEETPEKV